jgi:divalent metal cation (Fe/Co/Zn/Cd) transporter
MAIVTADRVELERRARLLAWGGNGWHLIEFAIAVGAGIAASSVALVAFGIDSLIEFAAGGVVLWLFSGGRGESEVAERRAQQLIAGSFYALAIYVIVESVRAFTGTHPEASTVGIGLALVTAPTMPLLARAKRRVGRQLGSRATESEGQQNMICAYLSVALLIGLSANALFGWWWADPLAGLVIAAVALRRSHLWVVRQVPCECAPLDGVSIIRSMGRPPVLTKRPTSTTARPRKMMLRIVV